jgi:hypothetical protein
MGKFTPGPWKAEKIKSRMNFRRPLINDYFIISEEKKVIPCIVWGSSFEPEGQANSKLIAAAPELLASCKEGLEALKDIINAAGNNQPYKTEELSSEFIPICDLLFAVINKAEEG